MVEGGEVVALGATPAGRRGIAAPGFVDLQVNGFAGVDLSRTDVDGYRQASMALARTGVTSFLPTVPTADPARYGEILEVARAACDDPPLPGARALGVHLEGPFLAPSRAGAHNRAWLQAPDVTAALRLLGLAPVRVMTLAPELAGGLDVVRALRKRAVVVAMGHSDADATAAHAAVDAGVTAVTHLWNAQRPLASREPGVVGVALTRPEVAVCMIADLVHVSAETLQLSIAAAGDRAVVVTDAVAAAGLPDGSYEFQGRTVELRDGSVRLPDGTLAGSACPMDQAVRNLVGAGVPLDDAIAMATTRPAAVLGLADAGRLTPGARADIVVLDDGLQVVQVLVDGRPV